MARTLNPELTDAQQKFILAGISIGKKTRTICEDLGIPRHILFDLAFKDPAFAKKVQRSRESWMNDLVEDLITITDGCQSMVEVHASRIKSENIKWAASKIVPAIYGDSINLNMNHTLDLSSVLLAAESRVIPILLAKNEMPQPVPAIEIELMVSGGSGLFAPNQSGEIPIELLDLV